MQTNEQTKGLSLLDHGLKVRDYFDDLQKYLKDQPTSLQWRYPDWLIEHKTFINTELSKFSTKSIRRYMKYHDCGKLICRTVDCNGKTHFPNHAEHSYKLWMLLTGNTFEAELMRHDMDIHLLKNEQVEEFSKLPYALILLLSGLCEIHANSEMFGGIESTSFKIKWKHINQRGKKILEILRADRFKSTSIS